MKSRISAMALVLLVHACASPAGTPKDGARVRTAAQVPQSQVDRPPSEPGPELLRASQEGGAGALGVGGCYRRVAEAGPVRGGPRLPGYPVAEVEPGACSSRLLGRPAMGAAGTSSRVAGAAGVPGLGGALGATSHGDPPAWSLPPVPEYSAGELAAIAANVLAEVNRARRAVGAPPLRMDPRLMRAAARYSRELAARQEIEHLSDTPGRRTFRERIAAEGARARVAGENLARIGTSAEELPRRTVVAWDRSPGHRRNMLDPMFARTGIAVALGKDRIWYVAQVYATSD